MTSALCKKQTMFEYFLGNGKVLIEDNSSYSQKEKVNKLETPLIGLHELKLDERFVS